jgi:threonine/homoserine/homoserine lactone efflux protein
MIALVVQGALLGLSAAAAPGPFQAVLVSRSLRVGPIRALPLAFVPLVSDTVVIAAVVAILTQFPAGFLRAVMAAGAVLVLWLAATTLRTALRGAAAGMEGGQVSRGFLAAAAVNVTNPNAWLFWSAVGGPIVTAAWRRTPWHALAFMAGFYVCITAGNAVLALLAGGIASSGPRAARALGLASGVALAGFGIWQLFRVLGTW